MESQRKDIGRKEDAAECAVAASEEMKELEKGSRMNGSNTSSRVTNESPCPSSTYLSAEELSVRKRTLSSKDFPNPSESIPSGGDQETVKQLISRISQLESLLVGKEAALLAVTQELEAVREMSCIDVSIGPLPTGLDIDVKATLAEYNRKLQEHAAALLQRDEMIQKLADSLKQSLRDRDDLKKEARLLTDHVHVLQTQLHTLGQHVQQPQGKLLEVLKEKDEQLQKKAAELSKCKAQSTKEVQFLMGSLEELQQRVVRSSSVSPPALKTKDSSEEKLSKELKDLRIRHNAEIKQFEAQLNEAHEIESELKKKLSVVSKQCDKLNLDLSSIKLAYETQLSVCKDQHQLDETEEFQGGNMEEQLSLKDHYYKALQKLKEEKSQVTVLEKDIVSLKSQLSERNNIIEKQKEEILFLQTQTQEYARNLVSCHQALEEYKKQIEESQVKFSEDLFQRDTSHHALVSTLNRQISELQETNSTQLQTYDQKLDRLKKSQNEDIALMKLLDQDGLNSIKTELERCKTQLQEKNDEMTLLEQQLSEKKQYILELGEKLSEEEHKNEKCREKVELLEQQLKGIDQACTLYQPQVEFMQNQLLHERQKSLDILQQLDDVRKQLSIEQDKNKSNSESLDAAKAEIEDLKKKNLNMRGQPAKLDQITSQQMLNASLRNEIAELKEKLKLEMACTHSCKNDIECLSSQLEEYSMQEKIFKGVESSLDEEKLLSSKYKLEIDLLNQELRDKTIKFDADLKKLQSQLQENVNLVQKYKSEADMLRAQMRVNKQSHFKPRNAVEQQVRQSMFTEDWSLPAGTEIDSLKGMSSSQELCYQETEKGGVSSQNYEVQIKSLESKLEILSEVNLCLKKEKEESEVQLSTMKKLFSDAKVEFEKVSLNLKEKLASRDRDVENIQKKYEESRLEKKEVHAYNVQIKELMSAKSLLEKELDSLKHDYCKEIKILQDKVTFLEEKLNSSNKAANDSSVEALVRRCQQDIQVLRSLCRCKDFSITNMEQNSAQQFEFSKDCDTLEDFQEGECFTSCLTGLTSLEKMLDLCDKFSNVEQENKPFETLACHLSKSEYTIEKLNLELESVTKGINSLRLDKEALIDQNKALGEEVRHLEMKLSNLQNNVTNESSKIFNLVSHWAEQYESVQETNLKLRCDVNELEAKLATAEAVEFQRELSSKRIHLIDGFRNTCPCEESFVKERDCFRSVIENLQRELVDQGKHYEEKLQSFLKKDKSFNRTEHDCDNHLTNLINDFSNQGKELILLQNELKKTQLNCQLQYFQIERQVVLLNKAHSALEESWQEHNKLECDLNNALKEKSSLVARLMRLETLLESSKHQKVVPQDLMWQVIETLVHQTGSHILDPSQDSKSNSPVLEKICTAVEVINKISNDSELWIARSGDNLEINHYLQSEASELQKLQASLLEIKQAVEHKTGSASQLYVDLLKQQLENKHAMSQTMREAHSSLEAELRKMEEQFRNQEEHFLKHQNQLKTTAKIWQLKAEVFQTQLKAQQVVSQCHDGDLSKILSEVNSIHLKTVKVFDSEIDRVASSRENKVRLEMSEKLLVAEREYKQQFEELIKEIHLKNDIRALQLLHQREIEAVRAECNLNRIKDICNLQEQLRSYFKCPLQLNNRSCDELPLLIMKQNLSLHYDNNLRKIALTMQNELIQEMSSLDEELENVSLSRDSDSNTVVSDKDRNTNALEELALKANELSRKLLDMQNCGLQSLLSLCEQKHQIVKEKLHKMIKEFDSLCNVSELQQELHRVKEECRATVESITACHKAEESRLRLLLLEQSTSETSEANETAMTILRKDLEEKHKRQMEELRTYFEQKCADFEKHYSEEVFSQHSRKLSDCSSASESELVSEMYYAGPGSSSGNGPGTQSHICDSLGESSFKDFEERMRPVDFEKLFAENKEHLETMRLALESRHQGELEAQKELYEARVEEFLRSMVESHAAELKLQSKQLQDMQEVETALKKKISEAEREIFMLKDQLKSSTKKSKKVNDVGQDDDLRSDLQAELQDMAADTFMQKDSENCALIASLKLKLRQNHEMMSKLDKDLSNLRSKYDNDIQSLEISLKGKNETIEQLNGKIKHLSCSLEESNSIRKQLELEMKKLCVDPIKAHETPLEEKDCEVLNQRDTASQPKLIEHEEVSRDDVKISLKERKAQLESEYSEYLEFVKKCADETKLQLVQKHEIDLKQIMEKHQKEISALRANQVVSSDKNSKENKILTSRILNKLKNSFFKASCIENSLLKLSEELERDQLEHIEALVIELCNEADIQQSKMHQEQDIRLDGVQKECERRFHLQLEEARTDIVRELELNIQRLLDDNSESDRPVELQELEKKFSSKYEDKLKKLQTEHENKISELCQKHTAQLSQVRGKNSPANITLEEVVKLQKERDCLRNVAATLRDVVAELVRYFMSWEDEFNNTLMDEIVKLGAGRDADVSSTSQQDESCLLEESLTNLPKDPNLSGEELPLIVATPARGRHFSSCVKRVHFAPNVSGILSFIDDGSLLESVGLNGSMRDASLNMQEELDRCLTRLRLDSAALYALSKPALPPTCSGQQSVSCGEVEELNQSSNSVHFVQEVERFRRENEELRSKLDILQEELDECLADRQALLTRLETLEHEAHQQAQIVAEGYGEGDQSLNSVIPSSPQATTVEELQHKARSLLLGALNEDDPGEGSTNSSQHLPHIVEELCRDWERLAEESRHKQDDLQQQVEVADKQLRATRTFMDEQAAEREQERDEFIQEISRLQELLRDKDRDRNTQQQMNNEVEALENQLKEIQTAYQDSREKLEKLNSEHKQAVEKIWTLRDIISDLEIQVASKAEEAASVLAQNKTLHQMLEQQGRTQLELAQEMEELQKSTGGGRFAEEIARLEEQLRKHQHCPEQFGDPAAIEHMKSQLFDLGVCLEAHTKELECASASSTLPVSPCLSSPSEDVSIRETLEAIRAANEKQAPQRSAPVLSLPFNQVSHVLEQWQKHARADDAILKKVRDLDMQFDDLQAEKETLSSQLQEQMLLSSSLQAKLDEHRRKAEVRLAQANAEMQSQVEDLKREIQNNEETLEARERQIEMLKSSLRLAEIEIKRRDVEVRKTSEAENNLASQLQYQVSKLSADKEKLQAILSEKDAMNASLPVLVENMLVEKNAEIDRLESQVQQLTKQMEFSSHYIATPSTTLEFEYCESDKVRAHVELSPVLELRSSLSITGIDESNHAENNTHPIDKFTLPVPQQMSLDEVGCEVVVDEISLKPINVDETLSQSQENSSNDTERSVSDPISSSSGTGNTSLSDCERKLASLQQDLDEKNRTLEEYKQQLTEKSSFLSKLELTLKDKDSEIQQLKEELIVAQESVPHTATDNSAEDCKEMQLQAKDSEIQRLRDEVCATQAILSNLQRKLQEAKQIARSPVRSSPDSSKVVRIAQIELETAKEEIVELKDLCKSIRSEVEKEYQAKQAKLKEMLAVEQETKKSLLETLDKMREVKSQNNSIEEEIEEARLRIKEKDDKIQKLQEELKQLNMECVTLRQQLSTPINEVASLVGKLDAEKKFADALKEELLLYKNRASSLDEKCQNLKRKTVDLESMLEKRNETVSEKSLTIMNENLELKSTIDMLLKEQVGRQQQIKNLLHKNTLLREENTEDAKELSDMKRIITQIREKDTSRIQFESILHSKSNELHEIKIQNDLLSQELSSLRRALKNINDLHNIPGLKEDDVNALCCLKQQIYGGNQKGAGDGVWNKLSLSETDVHEIKPSNPQLAELELLDDLTGAVQHELSVSVQLDHNLLETLSPLSKKSSHWSESKHPANSTQHSDQGNDSGFIKTNAVSGESQGQSVRFEERVALEKINKLEIELSKLQTQLESERVQYFTLQQQDCDLIEEMRIKLAEALDGQAALRLELEAQAGKQQTTSNLQEFSGLTKNVGSSVPNYLLDRLHQEHNEALSELKAMKLQKEASEKQLRRLQEAEIQRSRRRAVTEEKHRRRIDQLQSLQSETQEECLLLRQELASVNNRLQLAQEEIARDRDAQLKSHTPFVERLKNMNTFLEEHIADNVRMAKQMEDLTEEHRKLRSRIAQLEKQLAEKRSNDSFEAANAQIVAERAQWDAERKLLHLALNEAKRKQMPRSESDVDDRVSHLFGRYLRMQSYRKALIWQKRYLLSVIMGMNESKSLATVHLATLTGTFNPTAGKQSNLRQKFRSGVMVIIAIHRMKFMIERWQRGKRIGCGVVLQQTVSQFTFQQGNVESHGLPYPCTQPTSSVEEFRSGLSQSPPTLERPRLPHFQQSTHSQLSRLSDFSRRAGPPNSLSECISNFHLVQQRFDALLSNPPK